MNHNSIAGRSAGGDSATQAEPLRIVCQEVWGGNSAFHGPIELPGVTGSLYSRSCQGARGGDVHYLSVCGSGMLARLCIADVVGHGETVAAAGSTMHDYLRKCINQSDQRRVLRGLNKRLADLQLECMTTMAALTYFPPTHRLTYSYAGHEPAWYRPAGTRNWKRLELPKVTGMVDLPLAVSDTSLFSQAKLRVNYGDRIVVVTDGVLEAPRHDDGTQFGIDRLTQLLVDRQDDDCASLVEHILATLREHCGVNEFVHDDVTVLAIDFVDAQLGNPIWRAIVNRIRRPRGNSEKF